MTLRIYLLAPTRRRTATLKSSRVACVALMIGALGVAVLRVLETWGATWLARCPSCPAPAAVHCPDLSCPSLHCPGVQCPAVTCAAAEPCERCDPNPQPVRGGVFSLSWLLLAFILGCVIGALLGCLAGAALRPSRRLARAREEIVVTSEPSTRELVAAQTAWLEGRHGGASTGAVGGGARCPPPPSGAPEACISRATVRRERCSGMSAG